MNEMIGKYISIVKKNKAVALIAVGMCGLAIVFFSNTFSGNDKSTAVFSSVSEQMDEAEFASETEKKLSVLLSTIDGAGDCEVMVSVISSSETIYEKEKKSTLDNDGEKFKSANEASVFTIIDGDGNEQPLITKQLKPQIGGVTVVSSGANNITVKSNIINAISTVLNIGTNKVCVVAKAT